MTELHCSQTVMSRTIPANLEGLDVRREENVRFGFTDKKEEWNKK